MKKKKRLPVVVEDLITIAVVVIAVLLINHFLLINARIPSESMETTVMANDRIFGNRLAYRDSTPGRYDIVIFRYPDDPTGETLFIKRVIGMPGETLMIRDGKVYVNGSGEPLDDSFCSEAPEGDYGPFEIPDGCYFMMGDNRNDSLDSRFWDHPYVTTDAILGKAFFRYWPLWKAGMIS